MPSANGNTKLHLQTDLSSFSKQRTAEFNNNGTSFFGTLHCTRAAYGPDHVFSINSAPIR